MQKLLMPFSRQMMLCGYKVAPYKAQWGYPHYGIDVSSIQGGAGTDPTVYASGAGTVLAAGKDSNLGYGLAILYPQVYNHKTGEVRDLVARYMHLRSIAVKAGDTVASGAAVGIEGKEGTTDHHLHLEFDTDTKWPVYSPQVAGSNFWRKGTDSTVNPSFVLHVGVGQAVVKPTYNPAWLNAEDFALPSIGEDYQSLYNASQAEIARLRGIITEYEAERNVVRGYLDRAREALQ